MILGSPYAVYVAAAYGACALVLGGLAWEAWSGWRRTRVAWDRLRQGGRR